MSFFVTRPPAPVPGTWATSMPCSPAMRATTGDTNVFSPFVGGAIVSAGGTSRFPRSPLHRSAVADRRLRLRCGSRRLGFKLGSGRRRLLLHQLRALRRYDGEPCADGHRLALLNEDLLDDA